MEFRATTAEPPPLAGRRRELDVVASMLTGPSGRTLLVVGEAGIGKSSLVAAALRSAPECAASTGQCLALSVPLPLLPLADVIRQADEDRGRDTWIEAGMPRWALDELGRVVPDLGDPTAAPAPLDLAEGWRQQRLFEAIRRFLVAMGTLGWRAIVLEDLHWADRATLDALEYLLAPSHRPDISIIITTRDDPPDMVQDVLIRLQAHPAVQRLELAELPEAGTAAQVRRLLGPALSADLAREIHARSGGNPFFTEQLLSLTDGSPNRRIIGLPAGLEALLRTRIDGVVGVPLAVIGALAVAQRPLDETALTCVCEESPDRITEALASLYRRHLLRTEIGATHHELRHALLGDVVRRSMAHSHLQTVHGRLADHLAHAAAPGSAAEIATHLMAADRSREELRSRILAGQQALAVFAADEAAEHFRRAIELWGDPLDPETPDIVAGLALVDVYERAWTSVENTGDLELAAQLAEDAFRRLAPRAEPAVRVKLHLALGHFRRPRSGSAAITQFRLAVSLDAGGAAARDVLRARREYAALLSSRGDFDAAHEQLRAAKDQAELIGQRDELRILLLIDAWLLAAGGDVAACDAAVKQALHSLAVSEPAAAIEAASRYGDLLLDSGRLSEAVEAGIAAIGEAEQAGLGSAFMTDCVRYNVCEGLLEGGHLDSVGRLIDATPEVGEHPGQPVVGLARAALDLRRRRFADASGYWSSAPLDSSATSWRREYSLHRLEHAIWTRDIDTPLRETVSILEGIVDTDQAQFIGPLLGSAMRATADLAEQARDAMDDSRLVAAIDIGDHLETLRAGAERDPFGTHAIPVAAVAHGATWRAERARLQGASSAERWGEAAQAWDLLSRPHRSAYARWREGEALLAIRNGRSAAASVLSSAAQQAAGHGPLLDAIRDLARRGRIDVDQAASAPRTGTDSITDRVATPDTDVRGVMLTPRERAVLDLVTAGLTNAEIGATLFISPKTAGVHVSNILRKLGATSRVQAAVIAARLDQAAEDRDATAG